MVKTRAQLLICPVLAVASLAAGGAAPALAGPHAVKLVPHDGGRIDARVGTAWRARGAEIRLDGRRLAGGRRLASRIVLVPRRRRATPRTRWRRVSLRTHGSPKRRASVRFGVGAASTRAAPAVVLTRSPSGRNAGTSARVRFVASSRSTSCSLDGAPFRRCASPVAVSGLAPGRHSFAVRASSRRGASTATAAWSVALTPAPGPGTGPPNIPGSAPAGAQGPDPALAGWQLVFSDRFDAPTLSPDKWMIFGPNAPGHNGNGLRDGRAISVQNGVLDVTAQMLNGTLVSGGIASRLNQTYGRFEFRARTDPDPSQATSGVVLTWPQSDNWPSDGENDIYETLTTASRTPLHSFVHFSPTNQQYWFDYNADGTQWHHMAMEWEPTAIRFYMDGTLVGTVTDQNAIPDVPHHLCIQLDAFKQTMTGTVRLQVDDVRIYKRA